jgi:hypothetical protein
MPTQLRYRGMNGHEFISHPPVKPVKPSSTNWLDVLGVVLMIFILLFMAAAIGGEYAQRKLLEHQQSLSTQPAGDIHGKR